MKIAFICSNIEPGKDGVGDYTRQLASTLREMGHSAILLSLNDVHIKQTSSGIHEFRCPAKMSIKDRYEFASGILREFRSDWISLQFVCYGWNKKGILDRDTIKLLIALGRFSNLHVMFHELWLGLGNGSSLRERLVGELQRRSIFRLIRHSRIQSVHSSIAPYVATLKHYCINAQMLPLFGGIPIATNDGSKWTFEKFVASYSPAQSVDRNNFLIVGTFGSIPPQSLNAELIGHLIEWACAQGRRLIFAVAGKIGEQGHEELETLRRRFGDRLAVLQLGVLDSLDASRYLSSLDFGIATTPWLILGKSSSFAAMIEHGLPVISTRDDVRLRPDLCNQEPSNAFGRTVAHWKQADFDAWLQAASHRSKGSKRFDVALQLLSDLSRNTRSTVIEGTEEINDG